MVDKALRALGLAGIPLPNLNYIRNYITKALPLIGAVAVVYLLGVNIVSLAISGVCVGLFIAQPAEAISIGTIDCLPEAEIAFAIYAYLYQDLFALFSYIVIFGIRFKETRDWNYLILCICILTVSAGTNNDPLVEFIAYLIGLYTNYPRNATMIKANINSFMDSIKDTAREVSIPSQPYLRYIREEPNYEGPLKEHRVRETNNMGFLISTYKPQSRRRSRNGRTVRNRNVRGLKDTVFYIEEYEAFKEALKDIDETNLHRLYDRALRVHQRVPFDLTDVLPHISNTKVKAKIEAMM